jgi:hypothetical protein
MHCFAVVQADTVRYSAFSICLDFHIKGGHRDEAKKSEQKKENDDYA